MNKEKIKSSRYKYLLWAALTLIAIVAVFLKKPVPQDLSFHIFADDRTIWGISNFWNVISNIPFLVVGMIGILKVGQANLPRWIKIIYTFMFIGVFLTGLGSCWYHWAPNNNTLVYDRIPQTIVFMSVFSATITELVDYRIGSRLLIPLVLTGVFSVLWWHFGELHNSGDLRLYFLVQYYPIVAIPILIFLFPSQSTTLAARELLLVVVWYIIAKILEHYDKEIYSSISVISGHSLKHFAAAVSTWYLVRMFRKKYLITKML